MPRRRSRRRRRQRRRRLALLIAGGLLCLLALVAAAGLRGVLSARTQLLAAKGALSETAAQTSSLATVDGRATAGRRIDIAVDDVDAARTAVNSSLALRLYRFVPYLSTQRSGLVRLIDDSRTALASTRTLLGNVDGLASKGKVTGAKVPLDALATFETDIRATGTTLAGLDRKGSGLVGPLGKARRDFNVLARSTGSRLIGDADALKVARSIMGAAGPRHYLVALENNAEMRDQGAVLSYAAVTFDQGQIHIDQHGSVIDPGVALKSPAKIPIPTGTATVFGPTFPTLFWPNVTATADFAFSGAAMHAMYQQASGKSVDGVFALDVPAISALLAVVGPVTVPGIGQPLTAANAGAVLLHDLYEAFPPGPAQLARHEVLSDAATAVVARLGTATFDPVPLAQGLAAAGAGGHVRAWSADPGEEGLLEQDGLGGGPAVKSPAKTFHVAVENRNATKMDYFIRTATQQQIEITPGGSAIVTTTIVVHNTAPVGIKASLAAGPDGVGNGMTQAGEYWAWALLWGPSGAMQPDAVNESGLNLSQTVIDRIYAGQTKQASFVTVIPDAVRDGMLQLRFVPQARLVAGTLDITVKAAKWTLVGSPTWRGPWDKTLNLSWRLHQ